MKKLTTNKIVLSETKLKLKAFVKTKYTKKNPTCEATFELKKKTMNRLVRNDERSNYTSYLATTFTQNYARCSTRVGYGYCQHQFIPNPVLQEYESGKQKSYKIVCE